MPGTLAATELLDALPMAVVLVDPARRITGWNAAAEALYGHPQTAAVGQSVLDVLFEEDDRAAAGRLLDDATAGRSWEGDFRVRRNEACSSSAPSGWRRRARTGRRGWPPTGSTKAWPSRSARCC